MKVFVKVSHLSLVALLLFTKMAAATRTEDQSINASTKIGRWLSRSTSHYDFVSATPVGPLRSGRKFFVRSKPLQMASDYGVSYSEVPITSDIKQAYQAFGIPTTNLGGTWRLSRLHAIWSFANTHDFSYSWLYSDQLTAWGLAYKYVFDQLGPYYFSYRFGFSNAQKHNFYSGQEISNEVSASWYLIVADFYVGARHTFGQGQFSSDVAALSLPRFTYISPFHEIQYYIGATLAPSTHTRINLQIGYSNQETYITGKFSFRFDELYPTMENWFRDPRYLYK